MAEQWELDTLAAINERRVDLGLPNLEWSSDLEAQARNYWTNPALSPNVVKVCNCPHWTPPKQICDLLWCDELRDYHMQFGAVVIFNNNMTHAALALNQSKVGGNMPHKRGEKTNKAYEDRGTIGRITGHRDAVFLKNKYQTELNKANVDLIDMIHHVENVNRRKALDYYHEAKALREDLKAHLGERDSLSQRLDTLLEKELGQEYKMWKESPQGLRINTTEGLTSQVSQAGMGVVGNINPTPILKYLEKYPALSSQPRFSELVSNIKDKEKEIRKKAESYNRAISGFNHELPFYEKNVQKCQDNLDHYHKILEEGTSKIENCRYVKSFMFRMLPEDQKAEILIDTLPHTIEKWKNMITLFRDDLSKYQKQPFTELSY
jgi:hypothetical protein